MTRNQSLGVNELNAQQEYLKHMAKHGHYGIEASPAGLAWRITRCLGK